MKSLSFSFVRKFFTSLKQQNLFNIQSKWSEFFKSTSCVLGHIKILMLHFLAFFYVKMTISALTRSLHFPQVFPLISDRSVWHNGKHPKSKPVARHFNLPNHSKQHMAVSSLSLHQGSTESRKIIEQKSALLILMVSTNALTPSFCI